MSVISLKKAVFKLFFVFLIEDLFLFFFKLFSKQKIENFDQSKIIDLKNKLNKIGTRKVKLKFKNIDKYFILKLNLDCNVRSGTIFWRRRYYI